ncbi:MAG: hypothetical protein AAFY56_23520 [Pseudomonadota bacterium]
MDGIVHSRPWWTIGIVGVTTFALGSSGVLWEYLDYGLEERRDYRETVELIRLLQADMTSIQREIIAFVPEYLELRQLTEDSGELVLSTDYMHAATKLAKLVTDYNRLEARRGALGGTSPRWFPIYTMIPPLPLALTNFEQPDPPQEGKPLVTIRWEFQTDRALEMIDAELRKILEDYGQEYPSRPIPEVRGQQESESQQESDQN